MLKFERLDLFLGFFRNEAFAVQFPVGAGMRLGARGHQVGGDIAFRRDVGHDVDFVLDLRQLGEEFGIGVTLQDALGDRVPGLVGRLQAVRVRVVQENLGFQNVGRGLGDVGIVAQRQIQQYLDRRPALHVRKKLEREVPRDLLDVGLAENDLFQEGRLDAGSARRSRQRVVNEEL